MPSLNPPLRSALRFIYVTVSVAMGCFFACFRIKNDDCPRRSQALRSKKHPELVVSQNPLSSVFQCEEDHEWEDQEISSSKSPSINNELMVEAKFLKVCGTLKETPCEIRKAARKLTALPPDDADSDIPKFHSWLPDEATQKLQPDSSSYLPPASLNEMMGEDLHSQERSPSSCISDVESTVISPITSTMANGEVSVDIPLKCQDKLPDTYTTPLLTGLFVKDTHHKNKSVRFECAEDMLSSEKENQNLKIYGTPCRQIASKNLPYPTPLKVLDDIQTPETIFPASVDNLINGKVRIRSQYVHPVQNPVQNVSQWKALKEDKVTSSLFSGELRDAFEPLEENPLLKQEYKKASVEREQNVELSLSSWLKPPTCQKAERKNHLYKTPGDKPIIGLVATHWILEECADDSSKGWDGNGIPNSTNKYKEVSLC
ncbi:hypothetical protein SAY87_032341 [Trapa incisa]|uniref:Uncharacterized protein n=1 Tax=Trapa incisa TaxID=236973 RepID=A0AAN7GDV5_9MYRT|nr:hypothetical protein SAY87_032341 [Trapa incisa]